MVAKKVSISWAPGLRLTVSAGTGPTHDVSAATLAQPWVSLFFQGVEYVSKSNESVLKLSEEYRALLLDCKSGLERCGDVEAARTIAQQHVVWRFIELVYLTSREEHLSVRLESWYHDSFPALFVRAESMMAGLEEGRDIDDEQFWDTVAGLASVGARGRAFGLVLARNDTPAEEWADATGAAVLGIGEPTTATPIGVASSLFRECPEEIIAARRDGRWDRWQNNCEEWARSDELEDHEGVKNLLGVLAGDMSACAKVCRNWSQMLVACACYGRNNDVYGAIELACAEASMQFEPSSFAAGALTEAALGAPARAVARLAACPPTPWVAAHVCDLLVKARILPNSSRDGKMSYRAFYFLSLAQSLERHRGLWKVTVTYYEMCPEIAAEATKAMVLRVPIDDHTDPTFDKLVNFCESKRWKETATELCERVGAMCLDKWQYAAALCAFSRAGLNNRAIETANAALTAAEAGGPGSGAAKSLDCLVRALACCDNQKLASALEYVRLYAEFQTRISKWRETESGRVDAITAALNLLECGGLPRRFNLVTVIDVSALCSRQFPPPNRDAASRLLCTFALATSALRQDEITAGLRCRVQTQTDGDHSELVKKEISKARTLLVHAIARAALQ